CMPCKMLPPTVDEIAKEMKVSKINVDEAKELAQEYYIMSVPTLVAFKNGEEIERISGAVPKDEILAMFG
ncbi:MAG: thioredoxin family protein, partial [Clostridiales bacterium]|nr:thioredoxin family protein [Clostridiales bacterium]